MRSLHNRFLPRILVLVILVALGATRVPPAAARETTSSSSPAPVNWSSSHDVFYITVDPASDHSTASIIAIAVADEFNKLDAPQGTTKKPWAVPEAARRLSRKD